MYWLQLLDHENTQCNTSMQLHANNLCTSLTAWGRGQGQGTTCGQGSGRGQGTTRRMGWQQRAKSKWDIKMCKIYQILILKSQKNSSRLEIQENLPATVKLEPTTLDIFCLFIDDDEVLEHLITATTSMLLQSEREHRQRINNLRDTLWLLKKSCAS